MNATELLSDIQFNVAEISTSRAFRLLFDEDMLILSRPVMTAPFRVGYQHSSDHGTCVGNNYVYRYFHKYFVAEQGGITRLVDPRDLAPFE